MTLRFMPEAETALLELGRWVEERNTEDSGSRFVNVLIDKIASYALPAVKYPICKNKTLAAYKLSCISINDWVVAFKQNKEEFVVHYILYGPGLR